MRPARRVWLVVAATVVAFASTACSSSQSRTAPRPSSAARAAESPLRRRPLPTPVRVRAQPELGTLTDPSFTALAGARAEYGRLGGSAYEIEIPDRWNGRLVLWMHGYAELSHELNVGAPKIRRYLISHGYAWGASSFSSTSLIPGRAADETAALWDFFVAKHGRPKWTYAMGFSMGGWATHIVAERYANRFDGALGLCGAVGTIPALGIDADFFVAGAFVAGVTQAEFDATTDIKKLIDDRILPALAAPAARERFEDIMIDITGGPRAFDRAGLDAEWATKWTRARLGVAAGIDPPPDTPYRLGPRSRVSSAEFNKKAIRLKVSDAFPAFSQGMEVTGKLAMPLLTMHTTGDEQVPINQAQILRARVHAAGRDALLVQRVVKDPGHCGFSDGEIAAGFVALVGWVERGRRPDGTTLLGVTDLRHLDHTFELAPRPQAGGSGSAGRASLRGIARIDGASVDSQFIGAVVIANGLVTPCNVTIPSIVGGRFAIDVYSENESAGCGRRGAKVVLWTYRGSRKLLSTQAVDWPTTGRATVTIDFSTSHPSGAAPAFLELNGSAYRADGSPVQPGARVEAYIGQTRCGVASIRSGVFTGYILHVVGPDSLPGCRAGGTITFRVDGKLAVETRVNAGPPPRTFDLTLR